MASAEENTDKARDDGYEKCADEKIGRNREKSARFAYAAKVDDGDDDQNPHAE